MIQEFIDIFKNTYKEYYKKKLEAKRELNEIKDEAIYFKCKRDLVERTLKDLDDLYLILPKTFRQDYVQKTIDLLQYGTGCYVNIHYAKQLNSVYEHLTRAYKEMKKLYKKRKYDEVIDHANSEQSFLKNWYYNRDI